MDGEMIHFSPTRQAMQIRFQNSPAETGRMNTQELRDHFLIGDLMQSGKVKTVYSHYDRLIIGGAVPGGTPIDLPNETELKATSFLERRELGLVNIGGPGRVIARGVSYDLEQLECLYLGRGMGEVSFVTKDAATPAKYYFLSAPAHHAYPDRKMTKAEAAPVNLGGQATSNKRTIYKYIHQDGMESCQLAMGLTVLEAGSVWNSVPPHTHTRRMEAYFYFDLADDQRILHFMGEPQQTRHLVMGNEEAVISPPWSMHFGVGTASYGFIWGMAGENKEFTDMDPVPVATLR
jgi:4-deoxy-L-threo-5-hexosulose-uronate ketol-isomerase